MSVQEARALLGRLEYERGNYEEALKIMEEIRASALGASLLYFISHPSSKKKARKGANNGAAFDTSFHATSLLLEALYLKAKCLQVLGRLSGTHFPTNSTLHGLASRLVLYSKKQEDESQHTLGC